jgi:hypothetical protein
MAGGHGGQAAVAQVSSQEITLSPYRRSLFKARSSRNMHYEEHISRRIV